LIKNPADIIYIEKKVCAKKQPSWNVGMTAAENMANVLLQYTRRNNIANTVKKSSTFNFSPAIKYTGTAYTATKNVWNGNSLNI
jgi:hypothetical protein